MKLDVVKYSQRDSRWAAQRLGTMNGTTIGGYGCILTCMTMLANYFRHTILPNQMDDYLTDNGGYTNPNGTLFSPSLGCNLYLNTAFNKEFSDCSFDHAVACATTPAPMSEIDWFLNHGFPVVVEVDFDHDTTDGIQTHFVLIIGKTDDGHYIINDPWTGEEYFFDAKYGDPATNILQVNYFVGPVSQAPVITQIAQTTTPAVIAPTPKSDPTPTSSEGTPGPTITITPTPPADNSEAPSVASAPPFQPEGGVDTTTQPITNSTQSGSNGPIVASTSQNSTLETAPKTSSSFSVSGLVMAIANLLESLLKSLLGVKN